MIPLILDFILHVHNYKNIRFHSDCFFSVCSEQVLNYQLKHNYIKNNNMIIIWRGKEPLKSVLTQLIEILPNTKID